MGKANAQNGRAVTLQHACVWAIPHRGRRCLLRHREARLGQQLLHVAVHGVAVCDDHAGRGGCEPRTPDVLAVIHMRLLLCHSLPRWAPVEDEVANAPVGRMPLGCQAVKEGLHLLLKGVVGAARAPALRQIGVARLYADIGGVRSRTCGVQAQEQIGAVPGGARCVKNPVRTRQGRNRRRNGLKGHCWKERYEEITS